MTETAAEVIKSSLQEILVQASEAPIQADQAQDGIRYMNRLMARYATMGINLGYTKVTDLGDDITIPDGALDGLVKNLAISLARQYNAPVTQDLAFEAKEGLDAMRALSIEVSPTAYPNTLPIGSGNEWDAVSWDSHFYPQPDDPVLTEQSGYISVESETESE